ncbi:hypothetical protein Tco_0860781 [Tanacetum coccineum]|uniref:Uncharacterized protein n=1 Tax=Tanacetum coccineum TaxID=301880 RepID=A0ABQ5BJZ3_9ASTR
MLVHLVLVLPLWTTILVISYTSSLIASEGSFIVSSSRIPAIPGHVANLFAIPALYSARTIVVQLALVAQRASTVGVIVSCMAYAKLTRRVSMSFPTDSICSDGGGTAVGGGYGEGDLDLLRDKDGKSDGDSEDDDGKSDGGDDNDGISDRSSG